MRVVEISGGTGPAEALTPAERPDPVAGPGQIRIRVHAAGVNRPDIAQRQGFRGTCPAVDFDSPHRRPVLAIVPVRAFR